MRNSVRPASCAYAAMCALVACYGAAVLMFMHTSVYRLPLFLLESGALVALLAWLSRREHPRGIARLEDGATPRKIFLAAAGFSLSVSLVYLFAYFPGGLSTDTFTQWQQIRGEAPLSDWHPALHTLLLWLCTRIIDHPAFVLLVQGVLYACAVGYSAASMQRWHLPKPAIVLSVLYLSANPGLSNVMTFLWKDCALAIATLYLAVQLFEIHCSRGEWLRRRGRVFLLALTLALCAILRHNGIALSLAVCVWLIISLHGLRRRALAAVLLAAALFAGIKGPLYRAAGVQKSDTALGETIGLPMVILSHVYVNAPESLDEETIAFLDLMGSQEDFALNHTPGDWNNTKWTVRTLPEDHGYTTLDVFRFAAKAACAESTLALKALANLMNMPLLPTGEAYWRMSPYTDAYFSAYQLVSTHHSFLARALNWLCRLSSKPALSWLFWRPGVALLAIMAACVLFARRRPLTALLLPAGVIAYHLATTLMLSSATDFRFYLPTLICMPLALAALYACPAKPSAE